MPEPTTQFTVKSLLDSKFKNIPKTADGIRAAAAFIKENMGGLGTSAPLEWAKEALKRLDAAEKAGADFTHPNTTSPNRGAWEAAKKENVSLIQQYRGLSESSKASYSGQALLAKMQAAGAKVQSFEVPAGEQLLDEAFNWITGDAQAHSKDRFLQRANESIAQTQKKLQNELSNLANIRDIPADATHEERARLEEAAAKREEDMKGLVEQAEQYGLPVAPELKRVASGFIPRAEATMDQGRTGREQESTTIQQDAEGNYDIVGSQTGRVLADNVSRDMTEAQAIQNQRQLGSTPSIAGRPDLYGAQPLASEGAGAVATPEQLAQLRAGTLPSYDATQGTTGGDASASASASVQVVGATEAAVQSREQAAMTQNPGLVVTPEMRSEWLAESVDELRGNKYYQEVIRNAEFDLGTSLNRLVEDTRSREMNLAEQYKQNLKGTQGSLQSRGMLYGGAGGGVRGQEEKQLADQSNLQFNELGSQMNRGLQDISQSGERSLGSEYTQPLQQQFGNTQLVGRVLAGSPIFQPGTDTNVFKFQGGNYGDMTRNIEEEARTRAGERETAFRDQFSQGL